MTQRDLIINYLIQNNRWVPAYELKGKFVNGQIIGSEGDRRAIEIMHSVKQQGYYTTAKDSKVIIEARRNGKYKEYRVVNVEKPVIQKAILIDGRAVMIEVVS